MSTFAHKAQSLQSWRFSRQVFAKDSVRFCGQPIGLVVADSKEIARRAAALVHVEYGGVAPPILTIEQALEKQPEGLQQSKFVPVNITTGDAEGKCGPAARTK